MYKIDFDIGWRIRFFKDSNSGRNWRKAIGNVQLYPNRPLRESEKNRYVLKFYCPIRQKRIRKN